MAHEELKLQVYNANMALVRAGLVILTWGNVSGADRKAGVMAIKPSGVSYDKLTADQMVVLSIDNGEVVDGKGRPSSDTPTHLHLYREFRTIGGVAHTHSTYATSFAQAGKPIPCYGTTHADNFYGPVPCTRPMRDEEVTNHYELSTGRVIVETIHGCDADPERVPGVLVASHAPFTWGKTADKAVEHAIVLEFAAKMAINTLSINPGTTPIRQSLLDKHFLRKHGATAYYGQPA